MRRSYSSFHRANIFFVAHNSQETAYERSSMEDVFLSRASLSSFIRARHPPSTIHFLTTTAYQLVKDEERYWRLSLRNEWWDR